MVFLLKKIEFHGAGIAVLKLQIIRIALKFFDSTFVELIFYSTFVEGILKL